MWEIVRAYRESLKESGEIRCDESTTISAVQPFGKPPRFFILLFCPFFPSREFFGVDFAGAVTPRYLWRIARHPTFC
jgi:hypothetical protein